MAVVGALATLIATATGAIQLWQLISKEERQSLVAAIRVAENSEEQSWGRYRAENPEAPAAPIDSKHRGIVFTVTLEVRGMRDRTGSLRWRELDRDGDELERPRGAPSFVPVRPVEDSSRLVLRVWAPIPPVAETFVLEISFIDDQGVTRDVVVGPVVRIGRY